MPGTVEALLTLTHSTDYFDFLLLTLLFKNSAMISIFARITSFYKTTPTSKMNKINKLCVWKTDMLFLKMTNWPGFQESRLIYPPISVKSTIKFLIPRITNRGLKRSS